MPSFNPGKAVGKTIEKVPKQFPELCDIFEQHKATLHGFVVKQ